MRTKKDFPTGKLRLKYPVSSFDANKKYTLYYEYSFDFVEYVKKDLKYRLNANKIKQSRYENGLCGMNLFREFLRAQGKGTYRDDSIYLGEINRDLLDQYIEYRKLVKGNSNATINHNLIPIIHACERARDNGKGVCRLHHLYLEGEDGGFRIRFPAGVGWMRLG